MNALLTNGHDAEALVTAVFTAEKTIRRTLRQLIVSAGFTSVIADKIISGMRGLDALKNGWELYDPKNRKLTSQIPDADWKAIKEAAEMRNKLVHGERVYDLAVCNQYAQQALVALDNIKNYFDTEYRYSGWTPASRRVRSQLHTDAKVRISP